MNKRVCAIVAALSLMVTMAAIAEEPAIFAIRGARIVPVSGPPIENGTVVIRDGLIAAVGANVAVPASAEVIDGKGLTVYPGLIDALSTVGLPETAAATPAGGFRGAAPGTPATPAPAAAAQAPTTYAQGPEDRPSTTPWVNAADQISLTDRRVEAARNAGITTALVAPPRGIFPGFAALIDLAGDRPGQAVVKTPVALYATFSSGGFGGGFPGALMGVVSYVKQTFMDARHYQEEWAAYNANPRGHKRPQYDRAMEGIVPVANGKVPLFLPANTDTQIRRYLDLGKELGTPYVLYGVHQGYEVAPEIAAKKVAVLVSAKWPERERDVDPEAVDSLRTLLLREKAPSTPAALQKAGVKFAFYDDGLTSFADFRRNVKKSIDAGLPPAAALRAMTLTPAEIFGVDQTLGSIDTGKAANLVVADGDLFGDRTKIKYVFVDGRKFDVPEEEAAPAGGRFGGGAAPGAAAMNVSGTWNLNVEAPDGAHPVTAALNQQGGSLTGTVSGQMGTVTITNGAVNGNEVTFRIAVTMGGNNMDITFHGTVTGSSMSGSASIAGGPSMSFSGSKPQSNQSTDDADNAERR